MKTSLKLTGLSFFLLLLSACSNVKYCVQCVTGHLEVMSLRRPIAEVLNDSTIPETERAQLARVLEIREFAVKELHLPDNDSYRLYADIARPYVVWNIVAAPEFSLSPKQWCYPVVGCIAYQGYYDVDEAKEKAAELAGQGYDVDVYGVKAYSTLKWFDDPVLNTFLNGTDSQLAGLIFHELAHQVVYVADDCAFNEAFAKTVEKDGLRWWLRANANEQEWQEYLDREESAREFLSVLSRAREKLTLLYSQPLPADEKRILKKEILEELAIELRTRQKQWANPTAVEKWLERGLNNARLMSIATYYDRVPAFQALLDSLGGDLQSFYLEVGLLAKLPAPERTARLKEYGFVEVDPLCKVAPQDNEE